MKTQVQGFTIRIERTQQGEPGQLTPLSIQLFFFFLKFLKKYIYFQRQRKRVGEGQRERERISSKLCTVGTEPDVGLNPQTMRSWPEPKTHV